MTTYKNLMPLQPVRDAIALLLSEQKRTLTYKLWDGCGVVRVFVSLNMESIPSGVIVHENYESGGVHALNWDSSQIAARGKENLLIHLAHWIVNNVNMAAIGKGFGAGMISEIVEELE